MVLASYVTFELALTKLGAAVSELGIQQRLAAPQRTLEAVWACQAARVALQQQQAEVPQP